MDKLLSYVDKTPYFSSLNLNMSLGSHPFDWYKKKERSRGAMNKCQRFASHDINVYFMFDDLYGFHSLHLQATLTKVTNVTTVL